MTISLFAYCCLGASITLGVVAFVGAVQCRARNTDKRTGRTRRR